MILNPTSQFRNNIIINSLKMDINFEIKIKDYI